MEYENLPVEHQRNTLKNELFNLEAEHWQHHRALLQATAFDPAKHDGGGLALSTKAEREALVKQLNGAKRNDIFNAKLAMGRLEHAILTRRALLAALPEETPEPTE